MIQKLLLIVSVVFTTTLFAQTQQQCGFYIHSTFDSECITTVYKKDKPDKEHEESECLLACSGSKVKYQVKGNHQGFTFEWQVSGAENYSVASNGLSVNVHWLDITTEGQIILTGTDANGNVCVEEVCVKLIEKPTASFTSVPPFSLDPYQAPTINVCDGQEVQLINTSTGSPDAPIVGYFWSFDNGLPSYSTENISFIADIATQGEEFKVILEVQNECGCKDRAYAVIHIRKFPALKVDCYGTACEGKEATYTIRDKVCDQYLWSVEGGDIVSGQGTQTVTVAWNDITDGYGYLGIDGTHCGEEICPNLTYLPIPVIADNVPIDGPQLICAGEYYTFKLPTWASTEYNWHIYGANVINESGRPSELKIRVEESCTFTIHCDYVNEFLGCSGSATPLTVTVKSPVSITSESHACQGESIDFSTDYEGNMPTTWKVYKEDMSFVTSVIANNDFSYTFNNSGSYIVKAINSDFCADASTSVIITPSPVIDVDEISEVIENWVDSVCLNSGCLFSLPEVDDAYYVHWEADCGEPNAYDGLDYNVQFSGSVCDVRMYYVDKLTGCKSQPYIHHLKEFVPAQVQWNIPDMVCPNSQFTVSAPEQNGVLYEWNVSNPMLASIAGGKLESTVTIQTNAGSGSFNLILKRIYCDTEQEVFITIHMQNNVTPNFNLPSEICEGETLTLTPTAPSSVSGTWSWVIGNEDPVEGYTYHGSIEQTGNVDVTLNYTNPCGDVYSIIKTIFVNPAPDAVISFIPSSNSQNITFSVSTQGSGLGPFTYEWHKGNQNLGFGNPITVPYPSTLPTKYTCVATNTTTGCTTTESIIIRDPVGPCETLEGEVLVEGGCQNVVYTRVGFDGNVHWKVSNEPTLLSKETSGAENEVLSVTYQYAGIYDVKVKTVSPSANGCYLIAKTRTTIPLIPKMRIDHSCYGYNKVKLKFVNTSSILPEGVVMDEPIWKINGAPVSNTVYKPNGTYIVKLQIGYTYMGEHHTCFTQDTIVVNRQYANFTISPAPYCEGVPVEFNSIPENAMSYKWTFYQYGNWSNPIQNQSADPTISLPYLGYNTIKLTMQDQMGCWSYKYNHIKINQNTIEGDILAAEGEYCAGEEWELTYTGNDNTITQYDWSSVEWDITSSNSANYMATQTGTYQVTVKNSKGCVEQSDYKNICFKNTPTASILGNDQYCQGENIVLGGYTGENQYEWTFNGNTYNTPNLNFANIPEIPENGLPAGNYTATLKVTGIDNDNNPDNDCSAIDELYFTVHPKPSAPSIHLGDNKCIHQPPVDLVSNSGSVHWSTGSYSSHTHTFTSGYHSAYRVNPQTGCRSDYSYVVVPKAPDFDELMTGCYTFCKEDFSKWILGVSGTYYYYGWMLDGNILQDGNYEIPNLEIPQPGIYNLKLSYPIDNGNCHVESEDLFINQDGKCDCDLEVFVRGYKCYTDGCNLIISMDIGFQNLSNEPTYVEYVAIGNGMVLSFNTPVYIAPNSVHTEPIEFILNDYTPAVVDLHFGVFQGNSYCALNWALDINDYVNKCIRECGSVNVFDLHFLDDMSNSTVSYFDFVFDLGLDFENVQIESEQGQVFFPNYNSNNGMLNTLFSIENTELLAMAEAHQELCFTIYGCHKGNICKFKACIPADKLLMIVGQSYYMSSDNHNKGKGNTTLNKVNENQNENKKAFSLYPNPANAILNIDSKGTTLQKYAISSVTGTILLEGTETSIDISRLPQGTYLIQLVGTDNYISYQKFIKQ